jgi:Tol biopolymer transport system component
MLARGERNRSNQEVTPMRLVRIVGYASVTLALAGPAVARDEAPKVRAGKPKPEARPSVQADPRRVTLSRIAYTSGYDIRSMAVNGSDDVKHGAGSHPSYSNSRTRLAYAHGGAIKVVSAPFDAAAFANALTVYSGTGEAKGVDPSISLDGNKVTFATAGLGGFGAKVFVYTMGTNNPKTLIDGSGTWVFHPTFNASASHVAYCVGNPGYVNGLNIRRVSASGANLPATTAGQLLVAAAYRPAYSPSGQKLAFYRHVSGKGYDIFLADASGANAVAYAGNSNYDDKDASFGPSDASLTFVSKRDFSVCTPACTQRNTSHDGSNLWRGNGSGGSLTALTENDSSYPTIASPSWQ